MSQAGYTPIQLYYSTTAAAVPVNTNLANGELAINITDGKLYYKDNGGTVRLLASNATSAPVLSFSAGTTGFTPSSATAGAVTLAGTLVVSNGGTGLTTLTAGYIPFGAGTSAFGNSADLFWDNTNARLGIGTSSPAYKLDVSGIIRANTGYLRSTNTYTVLVGADVLSTTGGITSIGANPIVFGTDGTERMRLDSAGNLGLGVTPSAWSTGKAFEIGATGNGIWNVDNNNIAFTQNAYFNTTWKYARTQAASFYDQNQGVHRWFNAASGTAGNTISFTQAMTLDASGNLLVGTTVSGVYKLDIQASGNTLARIGGSGTGQSGLTITSGGAFSPFINFISSTSTTEAGIYALAGSAALVFTTGSAGTERFRIGSAGQLGIGGANYGTSGQVLTSGGSGAAPTWTTVGGGGGSPATPTVEGTVYGKMVSSSTATTALGYNALVNNTGARNTAVGWNAAPATGAGADLTAIGKEALASNTSGNYNVAVGGNEAGTFSPLTTNTTGGYNVAIGNGALAKTTTANFQTAIGYQALFNTNQTANANAYNTAVGYQAGKANTTGKITAFGANVLSANTTGTENVGVGGETDAANAALKSNTTGTYNTAVGNYALQANTTGSGNSAFGQGTLGSNVGGLYNTAVGFRSLAATTGSNNNVAVGYEALNAATSGSNTAVGYQAAYSGAGVSQTVAVGYQAMKVATDQNYALGYQAGLTTTTGYNNIYVGHNAGNSHTTGAYGTYIGHVPTPSGVTVSSEMVICSGYNGGSTTGKGADTGFIKAGSGGVYQGNNSSSWSTTSDQRLKKNIVDNNAGLDAINSIRVRNFEYRVAEEITELPQNQAIQKTGVQLGVIAQELQAVLPDCVKQESTGVLSIDTDNLTWYLVNAIKQLKAEIDQLKGNV